MSDLYNQMLNGPQWHLRPTYSHLQMDEENLRTQETTHDFSSYFTSRESTLPTLAAQQSGNPSLWPCYFTDQRNASSQMSNTNANCNPAQPMDHYPSVSSISPTYTMLAPSPYPAVMTTTATPTPIPRDRRDANASRTCSGLRNFSKRVMEKVKEKKTTSFDEQSGNPSLWPCYFTDQRNAPSPISNTNTNCNPAQAMDHYPSVSSVSPTYTMLAPSPYPAVMTTTTTPTPIPSLTTRPSKKKQTRYRAPKQDWSEKDATNIDRRDANASRTCSGLRNFSKRVMEKVKEKKTTSFDEIADEMFTELNNPGEANAAVNKECIIKSIQRRVYDILNVLVAMEMVSKDKKTITWIEQVSDISDEQLNLEKEKKELEESIKQNTADLQQLILQQIAYKNLLVSKQGSYPEQCALAARKTVHLPFIAVRTSKNTVISHTTSKDELEHVFNFDQPFQIHDNMEVLMRMGMAFGLDRNMCSEKNLEISRTMVSKELEPYLEEMNKVGPLANTRSKFQ